MKKKLNRVLKALLILFLLVLIIAPTIIGYYLNNNGKDLCGRTISLEDLSLNYFSGALTLEDFLIYEENDVDTFLFIQQLHVNPHLLAMIGSHYRIEDINIDGLVCNITLIDTTFNFNSLLHFFTEKDTVVQEEPKDSGEVAYTIDQVTLNNWSVTYLDKNIDGFFGLKNLNVNIPKGISWDNPELEMQSTFQLLSGGSVDLDLKLDMSTNHYTLGLDIDALSLGVVKPYVSDFMYVGELDAKLNTSLMLNGDLDEAANLNISGNLGIADVILSDTNKITAFAMNALNINIDSLNPALDIYQLSTIKIIEPYAHFEYFPETDNFSSMFILPDTSLDSTAQMVIEEASYANPFVLIGQYVHDAMQGIKASNFAIDTILLNNLKAEYVDHTLLQPFSYTVSKTNLSAFGVNSNADSLIAQLSMLLNGQGEVDGTAILHPTKPEDVNFYLKADKIALKDFTPFFHYFLGLPIIKGTYEMESSLSVKDKYLLSSNNVKAKSFTLGKKQKHEQAYNLPVKMGVAMLKDREGHIDLSLPVKGDLADPKYKIGKVILGILKELILKAASSPYNVIANSLEVDEESSKKISLVHIYDSLSSREYIRLDNIAQVLLDKPELTLLLNPYYNEGAQLDYLAFAKVKANFMGIALHPNMNSSDLDRMDALKASDSLFTNHINSKVPNSMIDSSISVKVNSLIEPAALKSTLKNLLQLKLQYIYDYLLSKGVQPVQLNSLIAPDNKHFSESSNTDIEFHILFDLMEP